MRVRRAALVGLVASAALVAYIRCGPLPTEMLDTANSESTVVLDRHGNPLYEALSHDGTRAIALTPERLPPLLIAATVAAEDHRYWSHPGVDPMAMVRALKVNLVERRVVEGGSTISQQVAKLLVSRRAPARHRGVAAKISEAILALRLEHRLTKQEILALYLNHAGYGNQIVGAERASRAYFGVPSGMLTPAQAAFLAGLPQRPSRFNPYRSRALAESRQRTVLARMHAAGSLSDADWQRARGEALVFAAPARPFDAPHFVAMVLAGASRPRPSRLETTLDRDLQRTVVGIIDSHRAQLTRHGASNVAVVVLDNATGEWLAWEGSGSYEDAEHAGRLNGPTEPRQPGSALKPFTYAAAFDHGYSPASVIADVATNFATADPRISYSPRNYDGRYRGPLLAREALAGSQNVPAVVLAAQLGVPTLLRTLSRAGFTTFEKTAAHYGLGVTLGNAEVRLDELVAAYAAFARGGLWMAPIFVSSAANPTGHARSKKQLFSPEAAFWITDILSDAEAREAVFGRGGHLEFPFPVAVKTGTSQAYHDNWTVGYSRHVTVGVWVGNFDRTPLRNSSGVTGAAPIFHAVMLAAEQRVRGAIASTGGAILARPEALRRVEICALSGLRANASCPTRKREWLLTQQSSHACDWHRVTADGGVIVNWPPEFREWASGRETPEALATPVSVASRSTPAAKRQSAANPYVFTIANPPDGATYLIDPTLRREFQSLPLRVTTSQSGPVEWFVNGSPAGSSTTGEALSWPLTPGKHRITARDGYGRRVESNIEVR